MIAENVKISLLADYRFLDNHLKVYAIENELINKKVRDGRLEQIHQFMVTSNLDYAIKHEDKERAKELFDLLKKINEKKKDSWTTRKIECYSKYLESK
jgi:hypothetical protein